MRSLFFPRVRFVFFLLIACVLPHLAVAAGTADDQTREVIKQRFAQLKSAPQLYVMVDKPLYHPGETIWFRAWSLPTGGEQVKPSAMTFELVDPRGSVVSSKQMDTTRYAAANDFVLAPEVAGGAYTLRVTSNTGVVEERPIVVATYQPPRIKKELRFTRKAYGAGDRVEASVTLEKKTGGPLANAYFSAVVTIDEQTLTRLSLQTNAKGEAVVRFDLPTSMARGDGLLTIIVDDGGGAESIQRRVPILLDRIALQLFPEGGELVEGLASRVYFRAKDLRGGRVDIEGKVVDDTGATVQRFSSLHDGLGRFEITPERHRSYRVHITRPHGIAQVFDLPQAKLQGCVMQSVDDHDTSSPTMMVEVRCTQTQRVTVAAARRDRLLGHVSKEVSADAPQSFAFSLRRSLHGAVRVTLFDGGMTPTSERLVYRGLGKGLQVKITGDRDQYSPRDRVALTIETLDGEGRPIAADVALAVVDDTVLNLADDDTANITARLLLESELPGQRVEAPNFYFSDDPAAPAAMDLVMGTFGWRRFTVAP